MSSVRWSEIPLWLRLEERLGFLCFAMGEFQKTGPKSGMDLLIDEATGHSTKRRKTAAKLLRRFRRYGMLHARETGIPFDAAGIDGLLALIDNGAQI